ncbi:glutathione peroxidase [Jannaschia seohaensis]|uniref:Glutathione peroxidase n=1 Tax=Jannaschia seohaensis TaxID=475081 RepID=A0A2Y9ANF5_9RHOB|nr:glutathione peroxidase [Jannaschia seohaensis]PWJ19238.1 glutathione peroxidase [Jannaschia seohaensis]SSA45900.1 glutathione peroxidase [Jannaschia seohaensis]
MLKWIAPLLFALPAQAFQFEALEGGLIDLDDLRGRAVLVVNTASLCGFTDQYAGLQRLHEEYGPRGLTVIGVPSNTFRQELGSEEDVAEFCEVNYGLTLPLTTITPLRGPDAHPFYRWLAEQGAVPRWNFNKALLDTEGDLVAFEGAATRPDAPRLLRAIEAVLPE